MSRFHLKNGYPSDSYRNSYETNNFSALNQLSNILYKNSFQKFQVGSSNQDDSLTSLNWLNNINISLPTLNPSSDSKPRPPIHQSQRINISNTNSQHFPDKLQTALQGEGLFDPFIRYEYKTAWTSKPPFSYTTLICMAMLELQKPKIALSEIYEWIRENFLFYRISDSSWQNSVRHNLSLKKCFEKVNRPKDERGKGGFWRINENYTENLGTNLIKYRRQFQMYASPQSSVCESFVEQPSPQREPSSSERGIADDFAAFSKRFTEKSNTKPHIHKVGSLRLKPVFKKPITLSSLNQYQTVQENEKVASQIRLLDPPGILSPTLCSFTDDLLLADHLSPADSAYSHFGMDDFESSSSFDTDFSTGSHLHSSSDDSYRFQMPLDLDDFLPDL